MNEQSRVQCKTNYTDIYIYIQRVKTIWKIKSEEQVNIENSWKVKWFFRHVSSLFKDLCLVVSIQTNQTFTSSDSIERLLFSHRFFPLLSPWLFIRGGKCHRLPILHTVQEYFCHAWQRSNGICVISHETVESGLRCWAQYLARIWAGQTNTSSPHQCQDAGRHSYIDNP